MKSTFLIISGAVLFSAVAPGEENYSLWPRRPAELKQAQALMNERQYDRAEELLAPYLTQNGIAGREARQILGSLNVGRYLSREHPGAEVYAVRRGDTVAKIAKAHKCPQDVLLLINGIVEPSALRVGQKLVVVPMRLRMVINPRQRELCVWDGDKLVADYGLTEVKEDNGKGNEKTTLKARDGYIDGAKLPAHSASHASANRVLCLENGLFIAGEENPRGKTLRMNQRDLNELALLLGVGAEVQILREEAKPGQ